MNHIPAGYTNETWTNCGECGGSGGFYEPGANGFQRPCDSCGGEGGWPTDADEQVEEEVENLRADDGEMSHNLQMGMSHKSPIPILNTISDLLADLANNFHNISLELDRGATEAARYTVKSWERGRTSYSNDLVSGYGPTPALAYEKWQAQLAAWHRKNDPRVAEIKTKYEAQAEAEIAALTPSHGPPSI